MTESFACPEIEILPAVLAFTADVAAARPCGLVTGYGPTPDTAVTAMREQAKKQGEEIVRNLWEQYGGQKLQQLIKPGKKVDPIRKLEATFSIGSVRLAAGQLDAGPGWVAYGTLLVDAGGNGVQWLQPGSAPTAGQDAGVAEHQ